MEWTDDLELFILKGYGKSLNYHMGVPLLEDVFQAMEQAIKAQEGNIDFLIFSLYSVLHVFLWQDLFIYFILFTFINLFILLCSFNGSSKWGSLLTTNSMLLLWLFFLSLFTPYLDT